MTRLGVVVAVVLIIGLLAGFGGGYLLTPTVTTTKTLTSTTTSPITITTTSPTTIYKKETVTSKITETVTETKTETSLITTTAYSTVMTTITLVKKVQVVTINSTFINLSLQYPVTVIWKPEGLNLTIKIRFRSYLLPPQEAWILRNRLRHQHTQYRRQAYTRAPLHGIPIQGRQALFGRRLQGYR